MQLDDLRRELERTKAEARAREIELGRCKLEGDGMREEVSDASTPLNCLPGLHAELS